MDFPTCSTIISSLSGIKGKKGANGKEKSRIYSRGGRSVHVSFGHIHLHGVGGDMKKAARELIDVIADMIA